MKLEYVSDKSPHVHGLIGGVVCHSVRDMNLAWEPGFTLSNGQVCIEFTEAEARQAITELQAQLSDYDDGTLARRMHDMYRGDGWLR